MSEVTDSLEEVPKDASQMNPLEHGIAVFGGETLSIPFAFLKNAIEIIQKESVRWMEFFVLARMLAERSEQTIQRRVGIVHTSVNEPHQFWLQE